MNKNAQLFIQTLRENGVTNPHALAAHYATGQHESRWSDRNLTRTWDDPSESGRPGTSGGAFSWRNERLQAMQQFTRNLPGGTADVRNHALFWLQENPQLIRRLNQASSVEEAMQIMNSNIRFAGWNRPNNAEAQARLATARSFLDDTETGRAGPSPAPTAPPAQQDHGLPNTQYASLSAQSEPGDPSLRSLRDTSLRSASLHDSELRSPSPHEKSESHWIPPSEGRRMSQAALSQDYWEYLSLPEQRTPSPAMMKTQSNPTGVAHGFDPSALNRGAGEIDSMAEQQLHQHSQWLPPNQNAPASTPQVEEILRRFLG